MFYRIALIALSFVLVSHSGLAEDNITQRTIHVQGEGTVKVIPDHAVVNLNLTVRDKDAKLAAQKSEQAMAEIVAGLKKTFNVADKDLQTDMIRIHPVYINCRDTRELARLSIDPTRCEEAMINYYNTSRSLTVKYRDLSNVPAFVSHILGKAMDNETVLSLNNISLQNSKVDVLKDEARIQAAADAKTKAKSLANALGAQLGEALQIRVDNIYVPVAPMPQFARGGAKMMAMAESAPAYDAGESFQAGEIEIKATISTIFALD